MYTNPPLITSVIDPLPEDGVKTVRNALAHGSDGLIYQLERLLPEYKNRESIRKLFALSEGHPIMVTNYAMQSTTQEDDESLLNLLLIALDEGASCIDIRGDMFDRGAKYELSFDENAVRRQKEVIKSIHSKGGQVIMSMHVSEYLDTSTVLNFGKEIESRGADIVKIVDVADTPLELAESFVTTAILKSKLHVPVLHLVNGESCELHRLFGTAFGSCLTFCVEKFIKDASSPSQPLLSKMLKVREMDCYKLNSKQLK